MTQPSTVDPTSLALPQPSVSPSPPPTPQPQPQSQSHSIPRKRQRSDMTAEEKREARAHRNRLAAQASRDKRKLQFAGLEKRLSELESENHRLRTAVASAAPDLVFAPSPSERELQKERENQELRERIKVLEQGWASVMQALSAAGQAIPSLGLPPSMTQDKPPATLGVDQGPSTASASERATSPGSTSVSSPTLSSISIITPSDEPTRHLAAGGNFVGAEFVSNASHQDCTQTPQTDSQIDSWLQDILQPVPPSPTSATSFTLSTPFTFDFAQEASAESELIKLEYPASDLDWTLRSEAEMEHLLSLLPATADQEMAEGQLEELPWITDGLGVF